MLTLQEKIILNTFIEIYNMNIINNNKNNLNIIFDNKHIPDKLIDIFYKKTNYLLNIVLETSILYSLGYSNKVDYIKYINFLEYYKYDINNIDKTSNEFKRITLYNTIKFLLDKNNKNIDLYKLDIFKKENKDMLKYINNNTKLYSINDIEKIILYKILSKYDLTDIEKSMKDIITTTKYDKDIISNSNGFIKTNTDIIDLKKYIIRKIIFDTYLIDKDNILLNAYITSCIKTNNFSLPKNNDLINIMFNRYSYLFYFEKTEQKYITKEEKTNSKLLKKINPFYKL